MRSGLLVRWVAPIALLAMAGCAEPKYIMRLDPEQRVGAAARVWPAPPDAPRYRYVGQLRGDDNFVPDESDAGFSGKKAFEWLVGLFGSADEKVALKQPQSGMVDAAGRILVTDTGRVLVFNQPAGTLKIWDRAAAKTPFVWPVGIVEGADGQVLVADPELGAVFRLDHEGTPLGTIGKGLLKRPTGLARDAQRGRIYVSDTAAHDIKVFDDGGRLVKTIGRRGEGEGEFNYPTHLAFARGDLYVADSLNSRIQVLGAEGDEVKLRFGSRGTRVGDLARPKGVAVDSAGDIYVVESNYDHLLVFNRKGALLLGIGDRSAGPGKFDIPTGVWVDRGDRVFVADMLNHRVTIFQFLGSGE